MTPVMTAAVQPADLLLAAKISVPGLPGRVISRPRLTERIAAGAATPLTVVTGPPGAGKTMALASWAAAGRAPGPVAWVSVDDHDNQPETFWSHVVEALRQAGAAVPCAGPVRSPGDAIGHVFLARLASVLAHQDPPVVLVLDDLHLITAPWLRQELAYVLRYAKSGLHLMTATRMRPPLPLHRYQLAGELTEIHPGDLSFTIAEAAQLLARHGITLPPRTLKLITTRVEGWAAGLELAALSLGTHPDPEQVIKNLAAEDTAITRYLIAEALDTQPAAIRDLMLAASIADRFNADLARALTGEEQAASTLAALARSSAFVQPLGHGWYRYHPLLAEVLRHQLRHESPGRLPRLHHRAARWHHQNGSPGEAVAHAAQISDWPLAAKIAVDELAVGDLLEPDASAPLAECLRPICDLPALADGSAQPQLLLVAAALQMSGGRDQAYGASLCAAERFLQQLPADQEVPSRLTAALIGFAAARRAGDLSEAETAAANAQVLFDQLPDSLRTRHPQTHAQVLSARGAVGLWTGGLTAAATAFGAAAAAAPEGSRERAASHGHLALIAALCGQLCHATDLAAGIKPSPPGRPAGHPAPSAAVALALVHLERHEVAAWHSRLKQADIALRAHPDRLIGAIACLIAARGALTGPRRPAAADLLQRARHGWSPPPWLDHLLTVVEVQACAVAGDIRAALEAAGRAGPESGPDVSAALARAWLAAGNIQAARQALAGAADDQSGIRALIQAHLTDALISYRGGDPARARRLLQRALHLGEPEGYRLPFVMDRAWVQPVLRHHPDLAAAGHWLLDPGQAPRSDRPALPACTRAPAPVTGRLTDRECEILQSASSLLTSEEIASKLCISVNTVKSHFKNIFCKLGTATRREAIYRATQLELI